MKHIEIERKFLIKMPDEEFLRGIGGCTTSHITQTYILGNARVRKWRENGQETYIKTSKRKISEMSRIEEESEITREEYEALLLKSDPERQTIEKTRYRIPYDNKLLEIDIFPFWKRQAFLEIELKSEDEAFSIPPFIEIIREVTFKGEYKNYSLAKNIPKEENF